MGQSNAAGLAWGFVWHYAAHTTVGIAASVLQGRQRVKSSQLRALGAALVPRRAAVCACGHAH